MNKKNKFKDFLKGTKIFWTIKKLKNQILFIAYSDQAIIRKFFKKRLGRKLNLNTPELFNDKLQWLKIYYHNPLLTQCVDKYSVRAFVRERVGERILNELYGVYDKVEEIDFNSLPSTFVLKATHGFGWNIICPNKDELNWKLAVQKMRSWMRLNHYHAGREWAYKNVKPRIVCERFLTDSASGSLRDYKFFCFNGEPQFIQVDFDRFSGHKRNMYDLKWNKLNVVYEYPTENIEVTKPSGLEEMIEVSRQLSKGFIFVRVDLYYVDGQIYFGELTFYPEAGYGKFLPITFEQQLGALLQLP